MLRVRPRWRSRRSAADRLHSAFEAGALFARGRQVRQARRAAEVAVEVAAEFEAAWSEDFLGKMSGFADPKLLLSRQRMVVVSPGGEHFEACLWSAGSEGRCSTDRAS